MPVAKTYAKCEIEGEVFIENKRAYVNVKTAKGLKKVRWYSDAEYKRMYPDVIIDYWYEESGMGFCGREVYLGGKPLYTEEADLEEHWIDDDDFEEFGYSQGYEDRRTQITEETSKFKKGTFLTREDRDECVFIRARSKFSVKGGCGL